MGRLQIEQVGILPSGRKAPGMGSIPAPPKLGVGGTTQVYGPPPLQRGQPGLPESMSRKTNLKIAQGKGCVWRSTM